MTELEQRLGRTPQIPEWNYATREVLQLSKGVEFIQLGRSVDEILASQKVTLDRESDDFIHSHGLRERTPEFTEVGVLMEPFISSYRPLLEGGNRRLYELEDEMRNKALDLGQSLSAAEQGFMLVNGNFPDVLEVLTQLAEDPVNLGRRSWTNTRVYRDMFLTVQASLDGSFDIQTLRAGRNDVSLMPLIIPIPVSRESGPLFYPQLPHDLKSGAGQ